MLGLIITLMVPYDKIDPDSALVEAFASNGADTLKNIVAIGALAGIPIIFQLTNYYLL